MKNIDINDLISKVNIVDVISNFSTLTKSGASLKTLCNVHGDKTPSLSINPKKQIYKCFVCDHGGNALDYLIWAQKFSWNDAIEFLIKESGENIEDYKVLMNKKKLSANEMNLLKAFKDSSDIFNYYLNIYLDEQDNEISKFINNRHLTKEIISKFKLGYSPNFDEENDYISILEKKDNSRSTLINASLLNESGEYPFYSNRLIFPIFNEENEIVAFSGRKINDSDNSPKYLNSKESLIFKKYSIMYNYNNARFHDQIIIVEGFMDVIAFSKIGKDNAIALMGLSISENIVKKLKKHNEILLFLDNDNAGESATLKLIQVFIKNNVNAYILNNNDSKDADEILNDDNGIEKLESILNDKVKMIDFIFNYFTSKIDSESFEDIKKVIIDIYKYSEKFDEFVKLDLISKISKKFNLEKDIITNYFQYKPNVIELKELNNKNIHTKNTLEFELNQPININKILISIWQNPSFLKSQNIGNIDWPKAEYKKIFEEIKNYHQQHSSMSDRSLQFIDNYSKMFKSNESLPKSIESFEELILRSKKDSKRSKLNHIDNLINKSNDENHKEELVKMKLNIKSRKW